MKAIGNIDTIKWNKKTRYVKGLSVEDYKVLTMHGSTGNGKSMIGTLKFLARIFNARRDEQNFYLAGRDIISLERRFIESNHSVFNWYPFKGKWGYKKVGVGGSRVTVKTRTGDKFIYLTPFNNSSAYGRILGDTAHGFLIDEATEADEEFLREAMLRVNRTDSCFAILTSNGGDPNHYFYNSIVNKSLLIDDVYEDIEYKTPDIERKYIEEEYESDDRMLYVHMGLYDNPSYTKEQIEMFYKMYPEGSFMNYSRVQGIRGFSLNSPFASWLTNSVLIGKDRLKEEGFYPTSIVFSVDSGGHVFSNKELRESEDEFGKWYSDYKDGEYGTAKGGHTVMVTVGFNKDYSKALLIDTYFPNHMRDDMNVKRMYDRVFGVQSKFYRTRLPYLFVDDADTSLLASMRDNRTGVRQVRPAVKRDNKLNLDEKLIVSLIQQYLMKGNLRILDTEANKRYWLPSMIGAELDNDGKLVDNRDKEADVQDATKYVFSSMYRLLV